ncbi:membrane protein [Tersicoccus solisilvae]|uniref:Membrane protein n=1 Tax=Tersicoccus solisilvae TaxID=1882339 RepID=A0ABQ1NNU3_9MICC|nr:phage holin family protein [Tersicoccus solisilvae]GGC80030.1 membrane protein [Tersicoccus solisilvae]
MSRFLFRWVVNALALAVAAWLLPGLQITADAAMVRTFGGAQAATMVAYVIVSLIFGLVNAIIRPVLAFLSIPITCLTLGLFSVVINALMLWLTAWLSTFTPAKLIIDTFFWTAVLAALIVSVVSLLVGWLGPSERHRTRRRAARD